ncbi:cob(I)yrinic acid a,c-diamide adenosyltransferase [Sporolactobacillus sp. THM7-4]|nr:cob(I)yrinic acid a,c-diamide adenosyltransferase [Sporolactobacillus sp. THM7-4]
MKLYTKKGDRGITQLVGGSRVSKDERHVCAYGTLDEVNAWIGYAVTLCSGQTAAFSAELQEIQQCLFDAGHDLAVPFDRTRDRLDEKPVDWLEKRIDYYSEASPEIRQFILPGGSTLAAVLHLARTVTRRAEREIVALQKEAEISPVVLKFINRLSDYLFAAARYANVCMHVADISYNSERNHENN